MSATPPAPIPPASRASPPATLTHHPSNFDSLDARVVQYKYAIVKLNKVVESIDKMLAQASGPDGPQPLILVQYVIYLSATMFVINESGFNLQLSGWESFQPVKPAKVTISQVVTHVPYDVKDQPIVPLKDLPSARDAITCLSLFKKACLKCLEGYQKRFVNALREINNDAYMADLETLFTSVYFDQRNDLDLTLHCAKISPSFVLPTRPKQDYDADPNLGEATLIDMDIYALFTLTSQLSYMLPRISRGIAKFRELKTTPRHLQDNAFKAIPNSEYSFHQVLFWALRLNDLYSIIRRFGRQIYLGNFEHLHDNKFLSQMPNGALFRTTILNEIDNFFNTAKKNGILIATITRFIRMNSKYEIRASNVLEFVGFIQQSFTYIDTLSKKFQEFGLNWIAGELSFRNMHGLPVENLNKLNTILQEETAKNARLKRELTLQSERAKVKHISKPASSAKPGDTSKPTPPKLSLGRSSRSSSISSNNESSSPSKESPNKVSSPANGTRKITSTLNGPRRPLSMIFLHENSSANSLQLTSSGNAIDKNKIVNTTIEGRRRSNSQPLSFNAAAVAALKLPAATPSSGSGLLLPSGSIRRATSLGRKPSNASQLSPLASKMSLLNVVNESEDKTVKLSANQKFQQHLREASKSGALFAQEKETFTNVVFDPNNPSSVKLKRYADPVKPQPPAPVVEQPRPTTNGVAESSARASLQKAQALRPTVAQVTKRNTQKNTGLLTVPEPNYQGRQSRDSVTSESSQVSYGSTPGSSSVGDDASIKKVRFTGVPDYHPSEDAPTSHSSRILKNFAAFKMPLITKASHAAFKKKDQLLKKEESFLFKQQLHPNDSSAPNPGQSAGSYVPVQQPLRLSKFRP